MIIDLQNIISYLHTTAIDPFPRYILKKEILCQTPTADDAAAIHASKWYKQLADEQWDDGSWGRFHSMDSRIKDKRKFDSTEAALRRAHELGLTKDNPIVAKCIKLMERYVRGEETWRDNIEKHHDNGKSHLHSRPYLTAAWLNLFDPENPVIKPKRDVFIQTLKIALSNFNKNAVRWLEVDFSDWNFANGKAFHDFKTAILERRIAEFDYYSTYGEMTHRRIEPIQL